MIIVFFHVLFLLRKYVCEKFIVTKAESNESWDEPPAMYTTTSCCPNSTKNLTNNQLDQFYDDNDNYNTRKIKFSPPAYIQRYNAVCNILRSPQYRGKIRKVVDFGCSELGFFNHLKNIPGIHEILCVDIDDETLQINKKKIQPFSADFLHMRDHSLNVYIYEGSVVHEDKHLENSDAIICIELIEHLYPETLLNLPKNIFEYIKPQLAIFTTPNADFNVLFPNMKGFRHHDHKFEWTRNQFESWATDIINKYPDYQVKFEGICPGPTGTEKYGCCTQMAVFNRRENNNFRTILGVDDLFKLVDKVEYPFRIDDRPVEVKILEEAAYYIRKYQLNSDYDDETMPFEYLTRVMDNLDVTIESFRDILSNGGYNIIDDESHGPNIMLPPISVLSDITNDSDVTFDDWAHPLDHEEQNRVEGNWGETAIINTKTNNVENIVIENESDKESIDMSSDRDDTSKQCKYDNSDNYESICSMFIESSQNENSLLYPQIITDPNFQFSIMNDDSSISMSNHDIVNDVLFSTNNDDNPQMTSTPNKKKSFPRENCRNHEFNDDSNFYHDMDSLINTNTIDKSFVCDIQVATVQNRETPSTSWSPEIITDSGYPNTYSAPESTPEYDLPSITPDDECDSESESFRIELPHNNIHDGEVENGDLANNNRDNEGNNMIAPMENNEFDNIQPFINVLENDLENENDIYDLQNGFPVWLLRIHDARFL